jgi:hypothetical protein
LALLILGGVMLELAAGGARPAVSFFGAAIGARPLAVAMIILAAVMLAPRLGALCRSLVSPVLRTAPAGAGSFGQRRDAPRHDRALHNDARVALALSEPQPADGSDIALLDAVRRAYRETRGTAAGSFADAFAGGPSDIVTMYATFIAEHVPIFGVRRSSSRLEQVSMSDPAKEFVVEDGALVLRAKNGLETYEGLRIKAADYAVVVERLRRQDCRKR